MYVAVMHNRLLSVVAIFVGLTTLSSPALASSSWQPRVSGGSQSASPGADSADPIPDGTGVYELGKGVTGPNPLFSVRPEYTHEARKAKLVGFCVVSLVVNAQGNPEQIRVTRSLGEGVSSNQKRAAESGDAAIAKAVSQYRFSPATYQGKSVPVRLNLRVDYGPPDTPGLSGGVFPVGNGVTAPRVLSSVDPVYTPEARAAGITGNCTISLVVNAQGNPEQVRVARSIEEGLSPNLNFDLRHAAESLDQSAVGAVSKYRFAPATYQGKPVSVSVNIEVRFQTH